MAAPASWMGRDSGLVCWGDGGLDGTAAFHLLVVFTEQLFAALVGSGGNRRLLLASLHNRDFVVWTGHFVSLLGNWWMGWRFTTSFGAEKKQETFSDFLLGGAAGGRLVFSFESSGQGGPMMK